MTREPIGALTSGPNRFILNVNWLPPGSAATCHPSPPSGCHFSATAASRALAMHCNTGTIDVNNADHTHDETNERLLMALQLRIWQQQPSKAVLEALAAYSNGPLNPDLQAVVLSALANPVCQLLPPNTTYVKRLVKQLIQQAEDQGVELSDQLLALHTALLCSSSSSNGQEDSSWRYKTYYYSTNPSWQQLQQLQQQHVQHCLNITQQQQQQQQHEAQCGMPAPQLLQLQQQQRQMASLVAAAGQQQQLLHGGVRSNSCQHTGPGIATADGTAARIRIQGQQLEQSQEQQQQHQAGLQTVHMSENLFEGGTGCHMWDAGFLLAEFVLNNPQLFAGKRSIEIGCGPGLVATCLCRVGTKQLLLTDGDPQTLVNCISNLSLNGHGHAELVGSWQKAIGMQQQLQQQTEQYQQLEQQPASGSPEQMQQMSEHEMRGQPGHQQVLACPLDWHENVPGLSADIIVGSDICYDPDAVPSLVRLLQQLLGAVQVKSGRLAEADAQCDVTRRSCVAYISTRKRQDSTLAKFERLASEHGLVVESVPMQPSVWEKRLPSMFQEVLALAEREERFVLHRVRRS